MDLIEEDIINGLLAGDARYYKLMVDEYQLPVVNTCLGILHNRHDAEDIAQDVFIEIFLSVRNFRSDSRLSTWIYRIAINKSINFQRKKNRQKWITSLEDLFSGRNETQLPSPADNHASAEIEQMQLSQNLHAAIDSLPDNQRIAFVLNKYDELSYKEISDVMNITVSSVESLIHRAKVNLQKKLMNCYEKNYK
jgi:RNA polymerase sigma-70 factor, ECF subfamily